MTLLTEQEDRIRRYLMGDATPDEAERVEIDLLRGDERVEQLRMIEDELITDYALDALIEREMEAMAKNFFITPERRERLMIAREMVKEASAMNEDMAIEEMNSVGATPRMNGTRQEVSRKGREWIRALFQPGWPTWKIAVYATIVIGLGLGVWMWTRGESDAQKGLAALNQVYRERRPLEAQITGFAFAPILITRGNEQSNINYRKLDEAEYLIRKAARERPDSESLHALGRLYLTRKEFNKASAEFTAALKSDPRNARLHNDQGVALMEGSLATSAEKAAGEIEALAQSLSHFNQALELDRNLHAAIFNRALLYERMMLPQQARDEWRKYLEADSTSPWAEEARRHLRKLEEERRIGAHPFEQPAEQLARSFLEAWRRKDDQQAWRIINRNRDRIGGAVIRRLIDDYLEAADGNVQESAGDFLQAMSYAGALELRMAGDRFAWDLAAFYKLTPPPNRPLLRQARGLMKTGLDHLDAGRMEEAIEPLIRAEAIFNRMRNECEVVQARYLLWHVHKSLGRLDRAAAAFAQLVEISQRKQYKWWQTQLLMMQVADLLGRADYSAAIERDKRALKISEEIEDANSTAKLLLQTAEAYYEIGNYRQSLKTYHQSLGLINQHSAEPLTRWAVYMSIALPLNSLGLHAAAAEYQREALRVALATRRTSMASKSYVNLAVTYGLQQRYPEAMRNAQLAFDMAGNILSKPYRAEAMALASLKMGQFYSRAGDSNKAAESFNQSIRLYDELGSPAFKYVAHKGRLIAAIGNGDFQPVEAEINLVLDLFEGYRARIREESNRNSFFDVEQNIYDIAIDFQHSRKHDALAAFELAERCRARSLLDLISSSPQVTHEAAQPDLRYDQVAPPMRLAEIQARMPKQAQILQYAALEDKLLIWAVSRSQFVVKEQKISLRELTDQTSNYLQLIEQGPAADQSAVSEASRRLYSLLIEPIEPSLDKQKLLCLAPDKVLNHLPFAALVHPTSGKSLIEVYSPVFAPSATMFVISSAAAAEKENVANERLLSVGDPSFDRAAFPALGFLPSARREAETVATFYKQSHPLIGEQATKRRMENALAQFDALHLALHCVVDERSPMRSKLLLAKPPPNSAEAREDDGALQAYEIYRLQLRRLRLVILSACRSGVERYYGGEGMVGVSRPFIAKRVPLVVASLWEVNSAATEELMIRFHEGRKRKALFTAEALRQAQLEMLHGPDSSRRLPYYWASFVCIGGYARF